MEKYLEQLKAGLDNHPHVLRNIPDGTDEIKLWKQQGKPYSWVKTEEKDGYEVFVDYSYSWLALFKNEILLGCGKHKIITENAIAMDKDYFGINKYLWF